MNKLTIYGDSISTGTHGMGGYEVMLKEGLGLSQVYNFAVGSSGLTKTTPNSMLKILEEKPVPTDSDGVLIWHGSNDWYWGSSRKDFKNGIETAVREIRKQVPEAGLVWLTPIFRYEAPDGGCEKGEAYGLENKCGHTLSDYCRQLEASSLELGFPLVDMRRLCNIHKENMERYLEDQVHPNRQGYEKISRIMIRELRWLWNL